MKSAHGVETPQDLASQEGLLFAICAYGIWGFAPIYFVWVSFAPAPEVLAHRVFWSVPVSLFLLTLTGQWSGVRGLSGREVWYLFATAICLGINWMTFIWAVQDQRIAEASLGYFINPIITIFLAWIFLGERLRPLQWLAVLLVILGVLVELWVQASVPWVGLALALSFGFYGLFRKQVSVPAALGLGVETLIMLPLALVYLVLLILSEGVRPPEELAALSLGGVVSVIPLVFFAVAALRLSLTTLGFVQYLAPTCALLLAVLLFQESVPPVRWITFALIWLALVLFTAENVRQMRRRR